jgi:hypothetical protein
LAEEEGEAGKKERRERAREGGEEALDLLLGLGVRSS